jgi:hypothetical protein
MERSAGFAVVACKASGIRVPESGSQFSLDQFLSTTDTALSGWQSPAAVMQPSVIVVEGATVVG